MKIQTDETSKQTAGQTEKKDWTDGRTDRQTARQTDRQTDTILSSLHPMKLPELCMLNFMLVCDLCRW